MAKYYTINKITKKLSGILGFGSNNSTEPKHDENIILIPYDESILEGLGFNAFSKSKVAIIVNEKIVSWEDDSNYDESAEMKEKLLREYTANMVNSRVVGSIESALDLVVQILNKYVNNEEVTHEERSKWNSFVEANMEHFKSTLANLTQDDIEKIASLKASARKIQKDMVEDERWPK